MFAICRISDMVEADQFRVPIPVPFWSMLTLEARRERMCRRCAIKQIFTVVVPRSLLGGTDAMAQPSFQRRDQERNDRGRNEPDRYDQYCNNPGVRTSSPRYSGGDRLSEQYRRDRRYVVDDWQSRHLRRPPCGHHWVRDDNNNYFLAASTTGMIGLDAQHPMAHSPFLQLRPGGGGSSLGRLFSQKRNWPRLKQQHGICFAR